MTNTITNLNELKAIKVVHYTTSGNREVSYISYNQFKSSFVDEKWSTEKRFDYVYTFLGYHHKRMTVTSPSGAISKRLFYFPRTHAEAEQKHKIAVN